MKGGSIRGVVELGGKQVEYEYFWLNLDNLILVKITRTTTPSLEKKLASILPVHKLKSDKSTFSDTSTSRMNKWKNKTEMLMMRTLTMRTIPTTTTLMKKTLIEARKVWLEESTWATKSRMKRKYIGGIWEEWEGKKGTWWWTSNLSTKISTDCIFINILPFDKLGTKSLSSFGQYKFQLLHDLFSQASVLWFVV